MQAAETKTNAPFGIRFTAFLGGAVVYFALATMNAWPNIDAAMHGDGKAGAMAFVQYTFAFIVAISSVASAHEKGGQVAVIVFMLVNGYFAYDAASHRHDEARTTISRKAIVKTELDENVKKRAKLGDFERVSAKQIEDAEHKRDTAETAKIRATRATRSARTQEAKDAQAALDRMLPLRTKTEAADNLDKAIASATGELKGFKATDDSDNSLASMAGADGKTLATVITLLLALGIELANKYGPYWTFRFIAGGLGYAQPSLRDRKRAQKAVEKEHKLREEAEEDARRWAKAAEESERREREREAEAIRAAVAAEEKAKVQRAAKRAEAKTREQGDPESVKAWLNSSRTVLSPGHVLDLPAAYESYAADCRAHGETPIARGKRFTAELRKLDLDIRERGKRGRFEIHGMALAAPAGREHLRVVSSR